MIIIFILIAAIFLGFILSGVMAPVIIAANRKQIRNMEAILEAYKRLISLDKDTEEDRRETLSRLHALKKKVWIGDKASVARADDILSEFVQISPR